MPAGFDKGAKVGRWEAGLDNPEAALKQIGALMVAESQRAFKLQAFGKARWAPRAVPNTYGIIADFALKGRASPPNRRFEPRPALRDTGRLSKSIAFSVAGNTVTVGTNLDYASVLHSGGQIESKPVTQDVKDKLARFLKGKGRQWASKLGHIFQIKTGDTKKGTVEARPFIGITKQTLDDVKEAVGVAIFEVGTGRVRIR